MTGPRQPTASSPTEFGLDVPPPALGADFLRESAVWQTSRGRQRLLSLLPRAGLIWTAGDPLPALMREWELNLGDVLEEPAQRRRLLGEVAELRRRLDWWLTSPERHEHLETMLEQLLPLLRHDEECAEWSRATVIPRLTTDDVVQRLEGIVNEAVAQLPDNLKKIWYLAEIIYAASMPERLPASWAEVCRGVEPDPSNTVGLAGVPRPGASRSTAGPNEDLDELRSLLDRGLRIMPSLDEAWRRELLRSWEACGLSREQLPNWNDKLVSRTYLRRVVDSFWNAFTILRGKPVPTISVSLKPPQVVIDGKSFALKQPQAQFLKLLAAARGPLSVRALEKQMEDAGADQNISRVVKRLPMPVAGIIRRTDDGYRLQGTVAEESP